MAAAKGNKYSQKYTEKDIDNLCKTVIEFAQQDGTVHFVEWTLKQGVKAYSWINKMAENYPKFAEAYKMAKELMANKLVKSSIYGHPTNNKFNPTYAMEWKSVYSQEWKDYLKWKADIQKEQVTKEESKGDFEKWAKEQVKD